MATAAPTMQPLDRQTARERVRHPLERLRGYIRTYVTLESAAILGLYLLLWFWIGLALDYGVFRLVGWDWVQILSWNFRAGLLGVLAAGLLVVITLKAGLRVFREFREPALALVLERRFPKQLGDCLITAVELADPQLAVRYGYSQAMVDATLGEAAEKVAKLPVAEVFDWRRLRRMSIWLAVLLVGLFLLSGGAWVGYHQIKTDSEERPQFHHFVPEFGAVAATWFERNLLLRNVIWPRTAYLELVGFPASGELRVGRDAPPPTIRAVALSWLVADSAATEGWRAMTWADITSDLLGEEMPAADLPEEWAGWTLDQIERQVQRRDSRDRLPAETVLSVDHVLEVLGERAKSPWTARHVRRLKIPEAARIHYRAGSTPYEQTFKKVADNEFAVTLGQLKESIRFTVKAEDYSTAEKRITLVPPPTVLELYRDELQPAYLLHRPPRGGTAADLRGKKHEFRNERVSLSGATSQVHVPVGTDLVLRAKTDKPLLNGVPQGVRLVVEGEGGKVPLRMLDPHTFEARFDNVQTGLDFHFEFTDTDNVIGRRHLVIRPLEDRVPDVDVLVDGLPKRKGGYMISPLARIPLAGKVRDDHGLARVEWAYTNVGLDNQSLLGPRALATGMQFIPLGHARRFAGAAYLGWLGSIFSEDVQQPTRIPVESFDVLLKAAAEQDLSPEEFTAALLTKPKPRLVKEHQFDTFLDRDAFAVEKLDLKEKNEKAPQPRYRLQLWIVATDNNIEAKAPGVSTSKEKFLFQVVSEYELLSEIAKDEENLHVKLLDTVNKLRDAKTKLDQVGRELPELKPEEFSPMARRLEELIDSLHKGSDVTREVHSDYLKILRELQLNQVQRGNLSRVEKNICDPLGFTLRQNFPDTEEALKELQKALEARTADRLRLERGQKELERLIESLARVLDAMGELMNLNKLITVLVDIEKAQRTEVSERLARLHKELEKKLLESLLDPPVKKP